MSTPVKISHPPTKGFWEIPVLFEDASLLALDKPAALYTSREPGSGENPDLMSLLHAAVEQGKPWAVERGLNFLRNANRLDFGVSGVVVIAKTPEAYEKLANAFGSELAERRYVAIVHGAPEEKEFELEAKIAPHPEREEMMRVDSRFGKKSRTTFKIIEEFRGWTLVQCFPQPDRPHQVRLHLKYKRLPVTGDPIYPGGPLRLSSIKPNFRLKPHDAERPLMNRPAVHLEEMAFQHPMTEIRVAIQAALPKDMAVALKYLRKYAARG